MVNEQTAGDKRLCLNSYLKVGASLQSRFHPWLSGALCMLVSSDAVPWRNNCSRYLGRTEGWPCLGNGP